MKAEDYDNMRVLRINAPEWYERDDFVACLEDDERPIATWHRKGRAIGEYSDAFCTYDGGEGDHADWLPEDIWAAICAEAERLGMTYAMVWISNLPE